MRNLTMCMDIIGTFSLRFAKISFEEAVELRNGLIFSTFEAGLIDFEEVEKIWLFVIPSDSAQDAFKKDIDLGNDSAYTVGGVCFLAIISSDWNKFVVEGVIAVGPNSEIIDGNSGAPFPASKEQKETKAVHNLPSKITKSSLARPFATFYIDGIWTEGELSPRIDELNHFLIRSGFLKGEDIFRFGSVRIVIPDINQTLIIIYIYDSFSDGKNLPRHPSGGKKSNPLSSGKDEDGFDPDILKEALNKGKDESDEPEDDDPSGFDPGILK